MAAAGRARDVAPSSTRRFVAERAQGATVLLTGPELRRTALLLALSGRLRADAGRVRVLGLVLPPETRTLRARSTFVDGGSPDTWAALEDSLGEIVFVLDADALHGPARDRLEAVMAGGDRTVVLSGASSRAQELLNAVGHRGIPFEGRGLRARRWTSWMR